MATLSGADDRVKPPGEIYQYYIKQLGGTVYNKSVSIEISHC